MARRVATQSRDVVILLVDALDDMYAAHVVRRRDLASHFPTRLYRSPMCTTQAKALSYAKEYCAESRYHIHCTHNQATPETSVEQLTTTEIKPLRKLGRTRIERCTATLEWIVRAYDQWNARWPEADYYTDDRHDAIATRNAMLLAAQAQKEQN